MTKFHGNIDGKEFDKFEDFIQAIQNSKDGVKYATFGYDVRDEEDERKAKEPDQPSQPANLSPLYPEPNIDTVTTDDWRVSRCIENLKKLTSMHEDKIKTLDIKTLREHIENLRVLLHNYENLKEANDNATDSVISRLKEIEEKKAEIVRLIAKDKNKLHNLDLANTVFEGLTKYYKDALEISERLLEFRKSNIADKKVEEPEEEHRDEVQDVFPILSSGLSRLFRELGF